jgi:hypothetical protein
MYRHWEYDSATITFNGSLIIDAVEENITDAIMTAIELLLPDGLTLNPELKQIIRAAMEFIYSRSTTRQLLDNGRIRYTNPLTFYSNMTMVAGLLMEYVVFRYYYRTGYYGEQVRERVLDHLRRYVTSDGFAVSVFNYIHEDIRENHDHYNCIYDVIEYREPHSDLEEDDEVLEEYAAEMVAAEEVVEETATATNPPDSSSSDSSDYSSEIVEEESSEEESDEY